MTIDELQTQFSRCMSYLIAEGTMDYLIGEDGKFYYKLTEKGRLAEEQRRERLKNDSVNTRTNL